MEHRALKLFLLVSTPHQEAVLSPGASATQLWALCHLEPCSGHHSAGLFAVFPTLPLETFPLVVSSPGADPLSPGSNTRYSGTHCLMFSHPFPPHSLLRSLFGSDLSFREEGVKCDNTALTSQENSKEEEFIHDKGNAKTSVCDHRLFQRPIIENYLSSPLSLTHMQTAPTPPTPQLCKGICFIPTRVGNLCLMYYTLAPQYFLA